MYKASITYLVLFLTGLFCSGKTTATDSIHIQKIELVNVRLDSAFHCIESRFNLHFSYFNNVIPNKTIHVNKNNFTLNELLGEMLEPLNLSYKMYGNMVIVYEPIEQKRSIHFKGQVLDQSTETGIPFAAVEIAGKHKGTVSDKNGYFEMLIPAQFMGDSIIISSLSYNNRYYPVTHFEKESHYKIYLSEKKYAIPEINIVPENLEHVEAGNIKGMARGSIYLDTHGQQTAIYIENEKNKSGILNEMHYFLSKKGNASAPLCIHVYAIDSGEFKPGRELLPNMVIVIPDVKKGWQKVNLLEFEISIPAEGIFLAIEGVFPDESVTYYYHSDAGNDFLKDEFNDDLVLDDISYGHRIGYNTRNKNSTWHYSITKTWFQIEKRKFNIMIGADIIYRSKKENNNEYDE